MNHDVYVYLAIMSLVTLAIRILPLTLIRRQITNNFIKSFLYYVPYVTLAVMTFPAILSATQNPWSGGAAMAVGGISAWLGASLFQVAALSCLTVFLLELVI